MKLELKKELLGGQIKYCLYMDGYYQCYEDDEEAGKKKLEEIKKMWNGLPETIVSWDSEKEKDKE